MIEAEFQYVNDHVDPKNQVPAKSGCLGVIALIVGVVVLKAIGAL